MGGITSSLFIYLFIYLFTYSNLFNIDIIYFTVNVVMILYIELW